MIEVRKHEMPGAWRTIPRIVGLAGLALIAVIVALNNAIARMPVDRPDARHVSLPPQSAFPFGTDTIGRDVLSETLHGLSNTAEQAALAALVAIIIGALGGFLAARLLIRSGRGARWAAAIFGAIPSLFLAILIVAVTDRAYAPLAVGIAVAPALFASTYQRILTLVSSHHSEFARMTGISAATLLRRDLVYEGRRSAVRILGSTMASATILLSTISFMGFGQLPPQRDLGLIIAGAYASAHAANSYDAWWAVLFPGAALILLVLFARLIVCSEGEDLA